MRWFVPPLFMIAAFAAVVAYEVREMRRSTPPSDMKTLDAFFDWQPGPHSGIMRTKDGAEHLVIFGPLAGFAPSGPPAYAFDRTGQLVDWTPDCGDSPRFEDRWHVAGARVEIDREFAREWTRRP